jgi:hypothetical protein
MKIIKELIIGIVLILVVNSANASRSPRRINLSKFRAMNTYIDAIVHGKVHGVKDVIDEDARFKIHRGNKFNTVGRPQVVRSLRSAQNIEQNCRYSKSTVWEGSGISVQKVDMRYSDFTRTDMVTLERGDNEWKITKVEVSFHQ